MWRFLAKRRYGEEAAALAAVRRLGIQATGESQVASDEPATPMAVSHVPLPVGTASHHVPVPRIGTKFPEWERGARSRPRMLRAQPELTG